MIDRRRLLRASGAQSLRVRLTASYALFFTLLLVVLSLVFRQYLESSLDQQVRANLDQDWATLKGYFRIEKGVPHWYVDANDSEEAGIRGRLEREFFVADANGVEMEPGDGYHSSDLYHSLVIEQPKFVKSVIASKNPVWRELTDPKGAHFLIRSSFLWDEDHAQVYFASIGRPLADNRNILSGFTILSLWLIPIMSLSGCVLGWVYVGRALSPVMEIARAAGRITGSNLSLRIPTRKTDDELDFLIETFNRMIERLEQSFTQIRQFSTDVSHELRTPITIVRGQLEVALLTAKTTEQLRDVIVDSLNDIERLSQLVRALLTLSQAETGQVLLQRTEVDLAELIRELVDQFQIPAEEARVRVYAEGISLPCAASVDRMQVERLISNLLSNAVKFTGRGGEARVKLSGDERSIEIEVSDTGCGIAPEHLQHVFDRFYRISGPSGEASPEKGLGLGLSFVAWIVKAHGGTIDVISAPGKGTCFTVRIPRGRGEDFLMGVPGEDR